MLRWLALGIVFSAVPASALIECGKGSPDALDSLAQLVRQSDSWKSGAEACRRLGLAKASVKGVATISNGKDPVDLCALPELGPKYRRFFKRLLAIHEKMAERFGYKKTDPPEALRKPLELRIVGHALGPILSTANGSRPDDRSEIEIGIFPDADLDEFPFDGFAHEYGHLFQNSQKPGLPGLLAECAHEPHLQEAIADIYGRDAAGRDGTLDSASLKRLLPNFRSWSTEDTYHQPASKFDLNYDTDLLIARCGSLLAETMSKRETEFCKAVALLQKGDRVLPEDRSLLEYVAANRGRRTYASAHALGIPFASDVIDLEKRSKIAAAELLTEAMSADPARYRRRFECHLNLPDGMTFSGTTSYVPAETLIIRLEEVLRSRGIPVSAVELQARYGIAAALQVADNEKMRTGKVAILREGLSKMLESNQISKEKLTEIYDQRDELALKMDCDPSTPPAAAR